MPSKSVSSAAPANLAGQKVLLKQATTLKAPLPYPAQQSPRTQHHAPWEAPHKRRPYTTNPA